MFCKYIYIYYILFIQICQGEVLIAIVLMFAFQDFACLFGKLKMTEFEKHIFQTGLKAPTGYDIAAIYK